ncbi:MAG: hypothetical protein LUQ11_12055, partial [Methylococcaceae bacterium]|nr:hypothetical protein [Methylococcaceae bacterium]
MTVFLINLKEALNMSFDRLKIIGNGLITFVASASGALPNHAEWSQFDQRFLEKTLNNLIPLMVRQAHHER